MVVVVEDRTPAWAILAVVAIVILVIVAVLVFILTGGRGTVLLVAIPGFPIESVIVGLALGLLLVAFKRRSPKEGRSLANSTNSTYD